MNSTVTVGDRRTFRSSLQEEDGEGILVRLYTGQPVEVIAEAGKYDEDGEDAIEYLFRVRAEDGTEFTVWETELIDHAQSHYVLPNGEYVADPEFKFLSED